jgi:hypothetical protein
MPIHLTRISLKIPSSVILSPPIRLSILMPIRILILSQVLHMLENQNQIFYFYHSSASLYRFLSHQRPRCHNFQFLDSVLKIF